MTNLSRRAFLAGSTAFALSACAVARDAPRKQEVLDGADQHDADFTLVEVTSDTLTETAHWPVNDPRPGGHWPQRGAGLTTQTFAPGDVLALRVWTAEETSLITRAGERYADIPDVVVSQSGHIQLPYVEEVHVSGLGPDAARTRIEEELRNIIPSAQVQITATTGRRNAVDMVDGVKAPGTYPLTERNLTLLNVLSAAGGVTDGLANPQVMITRGSTVYRMPYDDILENPAHDVALRGGDRVVVRADSRSFLALGATGSQNVIAFPTEELSALRAVSVMGGIADNRADPRGLLVLRRYAPSVVGRANGPAKAKVVFSFDLTKADRLFAADQFLLQDGDVVLATQAPATTTQRVLGLFGSFVGAGRAVSDL
jgi:polysaccharide export outer membrane protein